MLPLAGTARFPTGPAGLASVWPDPSDARQIATWLVQADNPVIYTTGAAIDAVAELVRLMNAGHPQSPAAPTG
jgi:hypothetical protein